MSESPSENAEGVNCCVGIVNKRGLHARAAARFVQAASEFDAEIHVSRNGQTVSGRSIMGLMMLAAAPGTEIEISAEGPACEDALNALRDLVSAGFDEEN